MSLQAKVKDLQAQLDEKLADVQRLEAEAARVVELQAAVEQVQQNLEATELALTEKDAEIAQIAGQRDSLSDDLAHAVEKAEAEKARADAAEKKLSNPAFEDASLQGRENPVETSGQSSHSYVAEYYGIKNLSERVAFYNKHQSEIVSELKNQQ